MPNTDYSTEELKRRCNWENIKLSYEQLHQIDENLSEQMYNQLPPEMIVLASIGANEQNIIETAPEENVAEQATEKFEKMPC